MFILSRWDGHMLGRRRFCGYVDEHVTGYGDGTFSPVILDVVAVCQHASSGPVAEYRSKKGIRMTAGTLAAGRKGALPAIGVGGLVAGGLDLISAFITFGWNVPKAIAGGLLGRSAFQGGAGVWALGVFLQFFIAVSAAAVYYAASRKLAFMKEHPLVCGPFFGIAVYLVMNLIVLPLCALHSTRPLAINGMLLGLVVHMILIGLPIAYSVRLFSK
jgi:hypothetical protein